MACWKMSLLMEISQLSHGWFPKATGLMGYEGIQWDIHIYVLCMYIYILYIYFLLNPYAIYRWSIHIMYNWWYSSTERYHSFSSERLRCCICPRAWNYLWFWQATCTKGETESWIECQTWLFSTIHIGWWSSMTSIFSGGWLNHQ